MKRLLITANDIGDSMVQQFEHLLCSRLTTIQFSCRVIAKDRKKTVLAASLLNALHERNCVEKDPENLLVGSLGKAPNGTPAPLCVKKMMPLQGLRITIATKVGGKSIRPSVCCRHVLHITRGIG